ncbi:MAG: WG repeat-containing protein [Bacteroidota bacterium]
MKYKAQKKALLEDRKGVAIARKNPEQEKLAFKEQVQQEESELNQLLESLSKKDLNPIIEEEFNKVKRKSEDVLKSSKDCLYNNIELTPIRDAHSGKIIYGFSLAEIRNDPSFVLVDGYSEGMARVKRNNKFGFYNEYGKKAIDFKYDYAENFKNGLSIVENVGRWYLIDKNGIEVVKFRKEVKKVSHYYSSFYKIKSNGEQLIEYASSRQSKIYKRIYTLENGIARVQDFDHKIGLIDSNGDEIVECKYYDILGFNEYGLAVVRTSLKSTNGLEHGFGIINRKGEYSLEV